MTNPTTISASGVKLITTFEGCRLNCYLDSIGVPTIGYGHTGPEVKMGLTITQAAAEDLLKHDLAKFEAGVTKLVIGGITQPQFDALVCFSYNCGLGNLGKSTLLKEVNAGNTAAAAEQFLVWNKAGGKVLAGLTRRRAAERELFLTPAQPESWHAPMVTKPE